METPGNFAHREDGDEGDGHVEGVHDPLQGHAGTGQQRLRSDTVFDFLRLHCLHLKFELCNYG